MATPAHILPASVSIPKPGHTARRAIDVGPIVRAGTGPRTTYDGRAAPSSRVRVVAPLRRHDEPTPEDDQGERRCRAIVSGRSRGVVTGGNR